VLRKTEVTEKRVNVQRESKMLLEYTRKAIAKLAELKKYASCPTFHILWKLSYTFLHFSSLSSLRLPCFLHDLCRGRNSKEGWFGHIKNRK
jgi:hypothetical protein